MTILTFKLVMANINLILPETIYLTKCFLSFSIVEGTPHFSFFKLNQGGRKMSGAPFRFRRCRNCGGKIHRRLWKNNVCPICELATTFDESWHGEIKTEKHIEKIRKSIKLYKQKTGAIPIGEIRKIVRTLNKPDKFKAKFSREREWIVSSRR